MSLDPQKSCEAHSQNGNPLPTAASSRPHHDSLSRCDLRGSPLAPCDRGEGASQPFYAEQLQRPFFNPPYHPATGRAIAFWCIVAVAVTVFLFWLNSTAGSAIR